MEEGRTRISSASFEPLWKRKRKKTLGVVTLDAHGHELAWEPLIRWTSVRHTEIPLRVVDRKAADYRNKCRKKTAYHLWRALGLGLARSV